MAPIALAGRCHCGNITVAFETTTSPERLGLRACQCGFCVRHGARCVTDPAGRVTFEVRDKGALVRYRFGLGTADFLICGRCGVYLGALLPADDGARATVNIDTLDERARFTQPTEPISYEAETEAERIARRRARWTPAVLRMAG
jgi:hypothetical protein